ncbi:probable prefoldin subunit 2 [Phlebotomus argentipes]|uniref:probable prefoldin subunit 2 n=1 Tax=Phlebotomus argentipes TaxID=94469 RepID=UPI002892E5F2|nr:probable prefoldin subunit 2 [Phlebotomus argentipes]
MASESSKKAPKAKTAEEIFAEFQTLRNEQRSLANRIAEYEMDLKEHRTVIDTLKTVDESRKCFRLIGGVLCEGTVKAVLPQLTDSKEQLEKLIGAVTEQLTKKGQEINKFKEENNIRIGTPGAATAPAEETDTKPDESQQSRNVLVVNN